jgi:hypothetical protein
MAESPKPASQLPEVIKVEADGCDRCSGCNGSLHAGNPCWLSERGVYCAHWCFELNEAPCA